MPLLSIQNLHTSFHTRGGIVKAVRGVSLDIEKGETVGIVGESGSGKSVTFYSLLGLIPSPPGRIENGTAHFGDVDLLNCPIDRLNTIRGKRISMIFQDPMTSLNPYMRIEDQLIEPLLIHKVADKTEARKRAVEMLDAVGIQDAKSRIRMYPHEFSGGMRQRVMIAMALITKPDLLIADEPTTALDVTVQAQILALIKEMQKELHMAVALVSHDLGVVAGFCDKVHIMYAGQVVESGRTADVFAKPLHPYNRALQESMPYRRARGSELKAIAGLPPDLSGPLNGCAFAERCDRAAEECKTANTTLSELDPGHRTSCQRVQKNEITC